MRDDLLVVRRAVEELKASGSPFALIGASALAVHGIPRTTLDVAFLSLEMSLLNRQRWEPMAQEGIEVEVNRGDFDDPLAGVVRLAAPGAVPVDIVFGKWRWLEPLLARAVTLKLREIDLPVVDAADLVLLKLDAGGLQDLLDVRLLLHGPEGHAIHTTVSSRIASVPRAVQAAWAKLSAEP